MRRDTDKKILWAGILALFLEIASFLPVHAETPLLLRPEISTESKPLTLAETVQRARNFYPRILQDAAEMRAAKHNVTLQKIREYTPKSLLSYQQTTATHNRLTQTLFSSPVLPTTPGPGPETVEMRLKAYSGAGFIVDWDPIDFGLHKARIELSRSQATVSDAQLKLTILDVSVEAANRFLDALIMSEQVSVAQANLQRFSDFSKLVHAQVDAGLKAGADASLADSQLANAQNDLIRAKMNADLARASLAYIVGSGGRFVDINPGGIARVTEPEIPQRKELSFESHPLTVTKKAVISTKLADKQILNKEYYPKLRWLGGGNLRGTTFHTNRGDVEAPGVSGIFPTIPNWNLGFMIDFPFFEIFRIQAEKKVVAEKINAAKEAYALALQQLKTEDLQAKIKLKAAVELASNMPVQVRAAQDAAKQAQARYEAGLATVAQVAESNQILADSRVKEAVANVGVWKALLAEAAVQGDLQPFLFAAEQSTHKETR